MSPSKALAGEFSILYFAAAADITKKRSEILEAPLSINKLFDALEAKYPGIKDRVLSSSAITVNLEYVDIDEDNSGSSGVMIKEGDEVAIIPPVSSG